MRRRVIELTLTVPMGINCQGGVNYLVVLVPQFISDIVNNGECVRAVMVTKGQARYLHRYVELVSFMYRRAVRVIVPMSEVNQVDDFLRSRLIIVPHIEDSTLVNRVSELDAASIYANVSVVFNEPPRLRELFIHLSPPRLRRGFNVAYGLPTVEAEVTYIVYHPVASASSPSGISF